MTPKEAIEELKKVDTIDMPARLCEAHYMAIKALEQESSGDAISRQAVLDGIEELKKSPWATDKRGNGFEYLITEALGVVADLCVKQASSVNPQEPKTDVLDKIRAEIEKQYGDCAICEFFEDFDFAENDISEYRAIGDISDILQIIDKYRESEG